MDFYKHKKMNNEQIKRLLKRNDKCVLSIVDDNYPYIIPMYYEIKCNNENIIIYLKSKEYSKKIRCINNNSNVCLLFYNEGWDCLESVVLNGKASIKEKSENNDCYSENGDKFITIKVTICNITGRIYYC